MPLVAAILAVLVALGPAAGPAAGPGAARADSGSPAGPTVLRWRECGDGLQCATATVPLVWTDPADARTVELALVRAPARVPDRRIGSLVVNPGGPGGSGVDFVRGSRRAFPAELLDRFDIVGFDPRGVGRSDPVDCRADMAAYYALDFSPDDDAERTALVAGVQRLVDACVRSEGDRLRHLTTDATVRDLDFLRAALGDDRLTFLGFSYGTYLGAKYAEAYPDRVRALVLDGAVDPALDARAMQVQQAAGFEGVLDGFFSWCAASASCAFHRDGDPTGAFDRLVARVDRAGLPVPGARPARSLSPTEFDLGLAAILYEGRAGYGFLAEALDAADRGNGNAMAELSDSYTNRASDGTYGGIEQSFLTISCADGPPVGTPTDVRAIEQAAAAVAPRTGPSIVNNSLACALWPFPGEPAAPVRAPTAPPILVIGTRNDPATPFAWAKALRRQLGSGVLVVAPGAQHTAFGRGIRCVDETAVRYLVERRAPKATRAC